MSTGWTKKTTTETTYQTRSIVTFGKVTVRVPLKRLLNWVRKLVGYREFPQLDLDKKDLLFNFTVWPLWIEEFNGPKPVQSAGSSSDTSD